MKRQRCISGESRIWCPTKVWYRYWRLRISSSEIQSGLSDEKDSLHLNNRCNLNFFDKKKKDTAEKSSVFFVFSDSLFSMKIPVNKGRNAPNTERHCQRASNHNSMLIIPLSILLKDIVKEHQITTVSVTDFLTVNWKTLSKSIKSQLLLAFRLLFLNWKTLSKSIK